MRRIALSRSTPDEYLYGRSGYLSCLLFVRREIGDHVIDDSLITEVINDDDVFLFDKYLINHCRSSNSSFNPVNIMLIVFNLVHLFSSVGVTRNISVQLMVSLESSIFFSKYLIIYSIDLPTLSLSSDHSTSIICSSSILCRISFNSNG